MTSSLWLLVLCGLGVAVAWTFWRQRRMSREASERLEQAKKELADRLQTGRVEQRAETSQLSERVEKIEQAVSEVRSALRETKGETAGALSALERQVAALEAAAESTVNDVQQILSQVRSAESTVEELRQRTAEISRQFDGIRETSSDLASRVERPPPPIEPDERGPDEPDSPKPPRTEEPPAGTDTGGDSGGAEGHRLVDRGGRPRGPGPITTEPRGQSPRVQLVARRESMCWELFIEVDRPGDQPFRVTHGTNGEEELTEQRPGTGLFGPLRDLAAPIRVFDENGQVGKKSLLPDKHPILLFRVLSDDFARSARRPSGGLNFAIVSQNLQYDERRSGSPPIAPESLGIPGYVVHYFSPQHAAPLVFRQADGTVHAVQTAKEAFSLDGDVVADDDERMGPLFVADPPTLVGHGSSLDGIKTVVLGEEGAGSGRWRREYPCKAVEGRWRLPEELRDRGTGWYFLRFYDADDNLQESLDFRYAPGLHGISMRRPAPQHGPPDAPICVAFRHDKNVEVRALDLPSATTTRGSAADEPETKFSWRPDPRIRTARFTIDDSSGSIDVTVDTDQIWWALSDGLRHSGRDKWVATPIEIAAGAFRPTSEARLRIRLPRATTVRPNVGFSVGGRRSLPNPDSEGVVELQLNEFSDVGALQTVNAQLKIWIEQEGSEVEFTVLVVNVPAQCKACGTHVERQRDLLAHLLDAHDSDLFDRLYLHEGHPIGRTLPDAVCVCLECGWFCIGDRRPGHDAVRLMERHYAEAHPTKNLRLLPTCDEEDIRNLFERAHEWVWRCKAGTCPVIVPTVTDEGSLEKKRAHLEEAHLCDLYEVVD